ncbi:MAG: carbohydrate binding family 9 domain-containing protein, partial [Gemmatimonadota bacterium]|nr:carbohydrate binding family 9 domain-containing protein [Gemmatimonadota bacterium]
MTSRTLIPSLIGTLVAPCSLLGQGPSPAGDTLLAPANSIRAYPTSTRPDIDGVLDEAFWQDIPPVTDFRQRVPVDGAPASERTELRIAFDENNLYFAVVLRDSDPDRIRRSILHREGRIDQDDNIRIGLDTYHDKRNAYIFEINPFGTQGDALITDESMTLSDWNWEGVYESQGRITEDGWVVEAAVPFTTIRFADTDAPQMGILVERTIRRKNEVVYFPHVGQEFRNGLTQVSQYATLTGLEGLRRGRYMEVKPFAITGRSTTGQVADEPSATETLNDLGIDFKYSLTSNLTLDATLNPDFAQVEADNVQINLTRFGLFFPEKREFFLERAGLFSFGDPRETEVFFSRRVGITNDIVGGGRLTGQAGPISIGALSLFTDD